jgi:hypothetical protein
MLRDARLAVRRGGSCGGMPQFGGDAQAKDFPGPGRESGDGEGHAKGLVRAGGVVVLAPHIDGSLGIGDRVEWRVHGQQLLLKSLVQPLDLSPWSSASEASATPSSPRPSRPPGPPGQQPGSLDWSVLGECRRRAR